MHAELTFGGDKLEYTRMGSAGIDISVVTLGAWALGSQEWGNQATDEACAKVIAAALDHGINILDTAPGYQRSQEIVGKGLKALGERRKELYIATKCTGDAENIRKQCEESLRLLGVETIDLYFIHGPSSSLPPAEQIAVLGDLRKEGKIRFVGVSNFRLSQHQEAFDSVKFEASQPCYGALWREIENNGVGQWCLDNDVAVMPFSPLAQGMLTGKFRDLATVPRDVRGRNILFTSGRFEKCIEVVDAVEKIGKKYGKTIAQTAIAWCIQSRYVTSAIVGARTPDQVAENVGGAGWRLDEEDFKTIDEMGRAAVSDVDPGVNIWGDHANWGT